VATRVRTLALSGVAKLGIAITAAAVVVQSGLHFLDVVVLDRRHPALDSDAEGSVAAWQGSVAQFAAALLVLLLAVRFPARRTGLVILAGVLAFFSFDDIVQVHEWLGRTVVDAIGASQRYGADVWPVLYLPLLAIVALGLWRVGDELGGEVQPLLVGGLALLGAGMFVELLSPAIREWASFVPEIVIEEAAELAGWGLIATALTVAVVAQFDTSRRAS
jgi:hypothetical protein